MSDGNSPELGYTLAQLRRRYPKYAEPAYLFVLEALHWRLQSLDSPRHLSGAELAESLRDLAMDRYGPLARAVLEYWGIASTADLGEVVFLLIEHGVLDKQDGDSREDFEELFSFEQVFELEYPWGR